MSGDKRNLSSLDSFVTITKRTLVTSSSSQQIESVQSELFTHEIDQSIDGELEELENTDSSDVNQNLIVVDSHSDTYDTDIGFQLSLRTPLTDEIKYKLLTKPFRSDKKIYFFKSIWKKWNSSSIHAYLVRPALVSLLLAVLRGSVLHCLFSFLTIGIESIRRYLRSLSTLSISSVKTFYRTH